MKYQDIVFAFLIFILIGAFTYLTKDTFYNYYIAHKLEDPSSTVLIQSFIVSCVWIAGLSFAILFYLLVKRSVRIVPLIVWVLLFSFYIIFWFINIKFAYFSGVEINPFLTAQAKGSFDMIINSVKSSSIFIWLFYVILIFMLFTLFIQHAQKNSIRIKLFLISFILSCIFLIPFSSSFKDLQEYIVPNNFFNYYAGALSQQAVIPEDLYFLKKLERFGYKYDLARSSISYHENIFDPFLPPLLPAYSDHKPNIIIVFLESFSNDLTSVYNENLSGLTPNLEKLADDPNITIFSNYYNASTPTVTGLISQLCSFLPPTGNEEMNENGTLVYHNLMCLPEVLKDNGYNDVFFLHAVEKSFSNKDKILQSAGIDGDRIYGRDEITELIKKYNLEETVGLEPLSWGYSDHQLYPVFESLINDAKKSGPFVAIMATVDTHVPYTNSTDVIIAPLQKTNDALNSFYTSDHAFGEFLDYFEESGLKDDTILIAVADHAAFPTIYSDMPELFEDAENKSFYDATFFLVYVPDSPLPEFIDTYSSSIDFAPTILHMLGINTSHFFEGHSIFYDRRLYPNLLGANEFQLYINQTDENDDRKISYDAPKFIADYNAEEETDFLTLTDYLQYYNWKREMLGSGAFWKNNCINSSCISMPEFIAHAGGGIQGLTYTNSLEALDKNYAGGFRYFEVDLSWSRDDQLVLIHDWDQSYKNLFNRQDGPPTALYFKNLKMNDGLTQMTLDDLFQWLDHHPDAKIVTDVKERNIDALKFLSQSDYMDDFVVQVYNESEISSAIDLGCQDIILTLYNVDYDNAKVLQIADNYALFGITMTKERALEEDLLKKLQEKGISTFIHTINDPQEITDLKALGADGFYTDFNTPKLN
jgi:phosphoglycerol transferase MdoB-like AlkP superfamily enzyme/glycerophosphoryl diester phosphodiesterase